VLDGESSFATEVVRGLGATGIKSHVLSVDSLAPTRGSRYVRSFRVSRYRTDDEFVDRAAAAVAQTKADVIVTADTVALARVVRLSGRIASIAPHAPVPSPAAFATTLDKLEFAAFAAAHGISHPATVPCTPDDAEALAARVGFPLIAKPVQGAFGAGIHRLGDIESLRAFVRTPRTTPYLLQQLIVGSDVDCSVLCRGGQVVAHTTQRALVQSGAFAAPDAIEMIEDDRVVSLVRSMMRAFEWDGVAHVDLRYDQRRERLYVIEVNPRFWGSLQGSIRAGVNFPLLAVQLALGHQVDRPEFTPCRFVSGSGALRMWKQALSVESSSKVIGYSETMLSVVHSDPAPVLFELARRVRRWYDPRYHA
jgi:predicted ATP-grasp superfamily ATP-dependent carboligase